MSKSKLISLIRDPNFMNIKKIKEKAQVQIKLIEEMQIIASLSRAKLQEKAWNRLREVILYASEDSPLYKRRFLESKVSPSIQNSSQLKALPFTTKDDLRQSYPFGFLATSMEKVIRYGESTGTTGNPTSSYMTYEDWERGTVWLERSFAHYFSPNDIVFVAIPYELAFAAYDIDRALENVGVTVVAVGTLNQICPWDRTLEMMRTLHPAAIVCAPTRALRLYDMFLEKGYNPSDVGLKTLFYVGETCSFAKLNKIAKMWNVSLITGYGTTETCSLGLICPHGKLHLTEDRFYFEIVDPETGFSLEKGERGELVLTTLFAEAMPLIRYRTGDIVIIEDRPCSCGLPQRTLQHYGRFDERILWKGMSILKFDLEETVLSVEGTGCYYLISPEQDQFKITIEVIDKNKSKVLSDVREKVLTTYGIEAVVEEVDKKLLCQAMDKMLKPGSLSMEKLKKLVNK